MVSQTAITEMTDQEFEQHTLTILSRELGLAGYARYLRLFRSGKGDYTRDRHKWQDGLTVNDILRDLDAEKHP
jgi:hypothetical protein